MTDLENLQFRAKVLNEAEAQADLGLYYYEEKIDELAFLWIRKSAENGNPLGQFLLSHFLLFSIGTEKDEDESLRWLIASAQQGFASSQGCLGAYCYEKCRYREAFAWFRLAANQGIEEAQFYVGHCYLYGKGTNKSYDTALYWLNKAIDLSYSQYEVGICYEYGLGVAIEMNNAYKFYLKAALQGHAKAQRKVAYFHFKGIAVEKDLEKSYRWWSLSLQDDPEYRLLVSNITRFK